MSAASVERLINIYKYGFWISLVIVILGLAIAAFTFFKFDIRGIWRIKSGKAKRESVQRMYDESMQTGKLRESYNFDYTTGGLKKKKDKSGRLGKGQAKQPTVEILAQHTGETGVFKETDNPALQTAVMTEWQPSGGELTAQLAFSDDQVVHEIPVTQEDIQKVGPSDFPFDIVEDTLVIHTDERVEI